MTDLRYYVIYINHHIHCWLVGWNLMRGNFSCFTVIGLFYSGILNYLWKRVRYDLHGFCSAYLELNNTSHWVAKSLELHYYDQELLLCLQEPGRTRKFLENQSRCQENLMFDGTVLILFRELQRNQWGAKLLTILSERPRKNSNTFVLSTGSPSFSAKINKDF